MPADAPCVDDNSWRGAELDDNGTALIPPRCEISGAALEVTTDLPPGGSAGGELIAWVDGKPLFPFAEGVSSVGRICLGESHYGKRVTVELERRNVDVHATARFVKVASCVDPGDVVPFFLADFLWSIARPLDDGSSAEEVDGVLRLRTDCSQVMVKGPEDGAFSVPDESGAALSITTSGFLSDEIGAGFEGAHVFLGREPFANLVPDGREEILCLPPSMRGTVGRLSFRLAGLSCTDSLPQELLVEDVHLTTDARCGDLLIDGDFEDSAATWIGVGQQIVDTGEGREARLITSTQCDNRVIGTLIELPETSESEGAALEFSYRYTGDTTSNLTVSIDAFQQQLAPSETMTRAIVCLGDRPGELVQTVWQLTAPAFGRCQDVMSPPSVFALDDVSLVSTTECF